MRVRSIVGIALLSSTFATVTLAADRVVQNGIDAWVTTDDGSTYVDFAKTPIPAGFFCSDSAPFTGRVGFRGEPVVTGTPGALGAIDTIVQRLDDAEFNKRGVAVTRIQFRALSLKSMEPIETACGKFTITARLDGIQPITQMRIIRESKNGGQFIAPLWLNVKLSFKPVGRVSREVFELPMEVRFPGVPVPWRSKTAAPVPAGFVLVDTDGDRLADTYLPGTSNFIAGQSSRPKSNKPGGAVTEQYGSGGQWICHAGDGHQHCFWLCNGCQIP